MARAFAIALLSLSIIGFASAAPEPTVAARIECTLPSAVDHIRQFAFDGDAESHFATATNPTASDHFTLIFDAPVALKVVKFTTGTAKGEVALKAGLIEVSEDGAKFEVLRKFAEGKAEADGKERKVMAIRIRPSEDLKHPLVIREIALDSTPKVALFRYPVEFTTDIADAPEMKDWIEKVVRVCEKQYPMICDELASKGFKPPTQIRISMKSDYAGVAEASGAKIKGSVKFFKANPGDIGAMVHETAHCVQGYRARGLPGWLVEGIADYVRFWKYEPGKAGKVNADRAKYDGSYRTTAAFLAFASEKYDPKLVNKLNALLRDGKYDAKVWKELTGKTVEELDREWKESLVK